MLESTYENIIKAQQGNTEVLESLVKNNMGLVYNIAKRFVGRGYEIEDLNQIGAMGLVKSIKKFDTNYNVQLSTYAVPFIIGEIKRYIRDDGRIKVSRANSRNFKCTKRRDSISIRCKLSKCGNLD